MLNSTSLRTATTSFMVLALIITSAPGSAADSTETASEAASIAAMEQQIIAQLGRGTEQQEAKGTHPAVSVSSTEVSLDNTTLSLSSSDDPAAREDSNAKSYNNKLKALRNLGVSLGANLTGIGLIARACG